MQFWTFVKDSEDSVLFKDRTPTEWIQFWEFVKASKTMRLMCPKEWMRAISDTYKNNDEAVTHITFQHLLMCSKLTHTRIVTTIVEYDNVVLWAKTISDVAVAELITSKAESDINYDHRNYEHMSRLGKTFY